MPEKYEYDKWNIGKQELNAFNIGDLYFRDREIWWCSVGLNIGCEENGKGDRFCRPVLILKKCGKQSFIGIPLSTANKRGSFYYPLLLKNGTDSVCLLTHIRLFDSRRLLVRMECVSEEVFDGIRKAVRDLI